MPTWIHTDETDACIGWSFQTSTPELTKRCTQSGDVAAVGWITSVARPTGLATLRTPEYLSWRYGFGPLAYRAVVAPGGVGEGLAVYRLRRRGSAGEAAE